MSRTVAESLATRVNHVASLLRPIQPLTITRASREGSGAARGANAAAPAILHITSLGLELAGAERPRIRIHATGGARVGLGVDAPAERTDTLRLDHLPAMTVDVTSGTVHLEIEGPSRMRIGGNAHGAAVQDFEARGRRIVITRSAVHVSDT